MHQVEACILKRKGQFWGAPPAIWHFVKILQTLAYLGAEGGKLRVVFLIEVVERPHVLGVADEPVHRRKVFALSELLVEAPEHLNNAQCGRRYWVREITTRWRHSTHNRHTQVYTQSNHISRMCYIRAVKITIN